MSDEYCVSTLLDNVGTLLSAASPGNPVRWYLAHNPGMELVEVVLTFHDDDHAGLLSDGTGSMSGPLNMGGNEIVNVSLVDGVDVSAHAARHLPGGADALTTAPPTVGIGDDNLEGVAAAFARADHRHKLRTGATDLVIGTINDGEGVRRSGNDLVGFTSFVPSAHASTHLPGGSDALTTAAPSTGIGSANSEGSATSFARSDHNHKLRTGATDLTVGTINDAEVLTRSGTTIVGATSFAPSAHKTSHQNGGSDELDVTDLTGQDIYFDFAYSTALVAQTTANVLSQGTSTIALGVTVPRACTLRNISVISLHDDGTSPPATWVARIRENGSGSDSATFTFNWSASASTMVVTSGALSSTVAIATTDHFGVVVNGSSIDGPKVRIRIHATLD